MADAQTTQLSMEDLQHLSDQDKQNYMNLCRMFESEGWKLVKKWAQLNADDSFKRIAWANTWEENRKAFGAHQAFVSMLNIEDATELDYRVMADEARGAKESEVAADNE
jgi:hypothetical protein